MWAAEDKIAGATSCEEALAAFSSISTALKDDLAKSDLDEECAAVKLLLLKQLNRQAHFRNKLIQDKVMDAKRDVGEKHLKLQNLLYEVMHLQKEVKKCLEFRSGDETIDLISMDEFLKDAPAEYTNVTSEDHPHKNYTHELQLSRLKYELDQRKELSKEHSEKLVEEKKLSDEILAFEEKLAGIGPKLDEIIEATKPVQEALRRNYLQEHEQAKLSQCLPQPLYTLYAQALAYSRLDGGSGLKVFINGDLNSLREDPKSKNCSPSLSPEPSDDVDISESRNEYSQDGTQPKKKRREDKHVSEDKPHLDPKANKRSGGLQPFPLDLDICFSIGSRAEFVINFKYYEKFSFLSCSGCLKVTGVSPKVSADVVDGDNFLKSLFDGPANAIGPDASVAFQAAEVEMRSFMTNKISLDWVNSLSGLTVTSSKERFCYADFCSTVKAIFAAMENRLAFLKELEMLDDLKLDFPPNLPFVLARFSGLSLEQAMKMTNGRITSDLEQIWAFQATLERVGTDSDKKIDEFVVLVPHAYPKCGPLFRCLSPHRDQEFREAIERLMNVEMINDPEFSSPTISSILAATAQLIQESRGFGGKMRRRTGRDRRVVRRF